MCWNFELKQQTSTAGQAICAVVHYDDNNNNDAQLS